MDKTADDRVLQNLLDYGPSGPPANMPGLPATSGLPANTSGTSAKRSTVDSTTSDGSPPSASRDQSQVQVPRSYDGKSPVSKRQDRRNSLPTHDCIDEERIPDSFEMPASQQNLLFASQPLQDSADFGQAQNQNISDSDGFAQALPSSPPLLQNSTGFAQTQYTGLPLQHSTTNPGRAQPNVSAQPANFHANLRSHHERSSAYGHRIALSSSSPATSNALLRTTPASSPPDVGLAYTLIPQTLKGMNAAIQGLDLGLLSTNEVIQQQKEEIKKLKGEVKRQYKTIGDLESNTADDSDRIDFLAASVEHMQRQMRHVLRRIAEMNLLGVIVSAGGDSSPEY